MTAANQTFVITGASVGIGRGLAIALCQHRSGCAGGVTGVCDHGHPRASFPGRWPGLGAQPSGRSPKDHVRGNLRSADSPGHIQAPTRSGNDPQGQSPALGQAHLSGVGRCSGRSGNCPLRLSPRVSLYAAPAHKGFPLPLETSYFDAKRRGNLPVVSP